ncbi:fibronectin type III domain-containing protein [Galbibacter sp.]|uniref:fibronectin type III domain-containing protein n=1 Tax=Galbibacter sp. TaxID=2918471 RepID=UPI002B5448C9|nr:fibronectin type III domain-containing protein [Galbibacter sp.]HLV61866.1 fibronectin type III domain-containing protein [Galbibacter sp.]
MRTTFTLLSTLLLSCCLWSQEIHTQSNAVSIENEADATTGWTGGAVISSESTDVEHGNFSMLITSTGETNGRDVSYTFNVTSGQVYSIKIWAKRAPQSYLPAFANWSGFSNFTQRSILTTQWTEYSFELTANSNVAVIRAYTAPINRGAVSGDGILLDAVSITPLVDDVVAPSAITDLTASSITSNSASLSWSASTDNVGVVDYEVFQNGSSIGLSGGTTSFNVTNLAPETSYDFTAIAIDAAGNTSSASNTVNVTTAAPTDNQAPTAITDLIASATATTSTTLSWSPSTDNVGVVDYEVFQDGISIGLSGGATTFNVTNLTPATSYAFTAIAMDAAGNISLVSNTANVTTTTDTDTQAPSAITDLTAGSTTSTTTLLSWSPSTDNVGVVDYELFQDASSIGLSGGATSFNVTNLAPETSYDFTVRAMDGSGNASAISNTVSVTTLEQPIGGATAYTTENANLPTIDWQSNNFVASGNVGVGTEVNPAYRLAVAGNIVAEEVRVALQGNWPDYVFENTYELPSLNEVEEHIKVHKHLINIPSAYQIQQQGIALGDMDAKLLRKIEELTLYAIAQEKQIQQLQNQNEKLKELVRRIEILERKLNSYPVER